MKTKLIKILYRLTAFLADKTQGFSLFSKWKIALGSLLIGVSVTVNSCVTCYDASNDSPEENPRDSTEQITCYDPMISIDTVRKIDTL